MKRVAIILADGFEEIEAFTTADILRRAGIECDLVSIEKDFVKSTHNIVVKADKILNEDIYEYDMIVLPGGLPGAENLAENNMVIEVIKKFNEDINKYIAAICASPAIVLTKAGIIENRFITSYPGEEFERMLKDSNYVDELVVVDGNLITSRGPATTMLFAYKIVDVLGYNSEKLKDGMLWNMLEKSND